MESAFAIAEIHIYPAKIIFDVRIVKRLGASDIVCPKNTARHGNA